MSEELQLPEPYERNWKIYICNSITALSVSLCGSLLLTRRTAMYTELFLFTESVFLQSKFIQKDKNIYCCVDMLPNMTYILH